MAKARAVSEIHDVDECDLDNHENNDSTFQDQFPVASNRVQIQQSPYIDAYYGHNPTRLTIDSGATGNMMIRASAATKLNAKITSSSQSDHQADGLSPLTFVGETRLTFTRDKHQLYFEGLVFENLDSDILAGIPFMEKNDISIRPARRQVLIGNDCVYKYGSSANGTSNCAVRRAHVARAPSDSTTLWPGDNIDVKIPTDMVSTDDIFFIEHHKNDSYENLNSWPEPSYDHVFSPTFKGYNGAVGALEAKVNMGPVQPPQRKGRIPQYSKTQLVTLQEKFNELEDIGVFKKPEDIGVTVEYLNPSFLIKKPNGCF
ncbi:unnamed protein product [Mytilus edulis]|uniref:Uncharacterized protein n=1 Tax=Mytilus edulis TaxID=6550 RepID=A0A8S3U5N7_MYTED|nr:unnamed protein product [Mytilus edulis]